MASHLRGAVVGYNMGRVHAEAMQRTEGIECAAICDIDENRTELARSEFPTVSIYNDVDALLADVGIDLVVVVLPHNLHNSITVQSLEAGKHVIVEKPMCVTIAEADQMIHAAKEAGLMLSVHHNRRWDADYWTLRGLVKSGVIGHVYSVEIWAGGYGKPDPNSWRSVKAISGGAFYDWGAHYLDWLLDIIEEKMINVTGCYQPNLVWRDITNEDHVQAVIRFANNSVANVQMSSIAKIGAPLWKLLGSHGAIVSEGNQFKVLSEVEGQPKEQAVGFHERPGSSFYENIVAHLNNTEPLVVTPESARRVVAVMELSEKSSKTHQAETVPYEYEV